MKLMLKKVWWLLYIQLNTSVLPSAKCQQPLSATGKCKEKVFFQKVLKKYFLKSDQDQ